MNFFASLLLSGAVSYLFYYFYHECNNVLELDYPYVFMIMYGFLDTKLEDLGLYYYLYCFLIRFIKTFLISALAYQKLIYNPDSFLQAFKTLAIFHAITFVSQRFLRSLMRYEYFVNFCNVISYATNSYVVRNVYKLSCSSEKKIVIIQSFYLAATALKVLDCRIRLRSVDYGSVLKSLLKSAFSWNLSVLLMYVQANNVFDYSHHFRHLYQNNDIIPKHDDFDQRSNYDLLNMNVFILWSVLYPFFYSIKVKPAKLEQDAPVKAKKD